VPQIIGPLTAGVTYSVPLVLAAVPGVPPRVYTGAELLEATLHPPGGGPAVATLAATWLSPATPSVTLTLGGAATAQLNLGGYLLSLLAGGIPAVRGVAVVLEPGIPAFPVADDKTASGSEIPYATPRDVRLRYDVRPVGDLVRDDDTQATADATDTDAVLMEILKDASGRVEAAVLVGNRYSSADLDSIAAGRTNSGALLRRIVCDLAAEELRRRRMIVVDEPLPGYKEALEYLDQLRGGSAIFTFAESGDAGLVASSPYDDSDLDRLNLVSSRTRFFGVRQNRLASWHDGRRRDRF
jgi:hypothetical protein